MYRKRNMENVFVLTRKEVVPKDNQTEVTIVGVYQIKSAAVIDALAECRLIENELKENDEKYKVAKMEDLTIIDCGEKENGLYDKEYFIEINEFEIGKIKNTFV